MGLLSLKHLKKVIINSKRKPVKMGMKAENFTIASLRSTGEKWNFNVSDI